MKTAQTIKFNTRLLASTVLLMPAYLPPTLEASYTPLPHLYGTSTGTNLNNSANLANTYIAQDSQIVRFNYSSDLSSSLNIEQISKGNEVIISDLSSSLNIEQISKGNEVIIGSAEHPQTATFIIKHPTLTSGDQDSFIALSGAGSEVITQQPSGSTTPILVCNAPSCTSSMTDPHDTIYAPRNSSNETLEFTLKADSNSATQVTIDDSFNNTNQAPLTLDAEKNLTVSNYSDGHILLRSATSSTPNLNFTNDGTGASITSNASTHTVITNGSPTHTSPTLTSLILDSVDEYNSDTVSNYSIITTLTDSSNKPYTITNQSSGSINTLSLSTTTTSDVANALRKVQNDGTIGQLNNSSKQPTQLNNHKRINTIAFEASSYNGSETPVTHDLDNINSNGSRIYNSLQNVVTELDASSAGIFDQPLRDPSLITPDLIHTWEQSLSTHLTSYLANTPAIGSVTIQTNNQLNIQNKPNAVLAYVNVQDNSTTQTHTLSNQSADIGIVQSQSSQGLNISNTSNATIESILLRGNGQTTQNQTQTINNTSQGMGNVNNKGIQSILINTPQPTTITNSGSIGFIAANVLQSHAPSSTNTIQNGTTDPNSGSAQDGLIDTLIYSSSNPLELTNDTGSTISTLQLQDAEGYSGVYGARTITNNGIITNYSDTSTQAATFTGASAVSISLTAQGDGVSLKTIYLAPHSSEVPHTVNEITLASTQPIDMSIPTGNIIQSLTATEDQTGDVTLASDATIYNASISANANVSITNDSPNSINQISFDGQTISPAGSYTLSNPGAVWNLSADTTLPLGIHNTSGTSNSQTTYGTIALASGATFQASDLVVVNDTSTTFIAPSTIAIDTDRKLFIQNAGTVASNAIHPPHTIPDSLNHSMTFSGNGTLYFYQEGSTSESTPTTVELSGFTGAAIISNAATHRVLKASYQIPTSNNASLYLGGDTNLTYEPIRTQSQSNNAEVLFYGAGGKTIEVSNANNTYQDHLYFCASNDCAAEKTSITQSLDTIGSNTNILFMQNAAGSGSNPPPTLTANTPTNFSTSTGFSIQNPTATQSTDYTVHYTDSSQETRGNIRFEDGTTLSSFTLTSNTSASASSVDSAPKFYQYAVAPATTPASFTTYTFGNSTTPVDVDFYMRKDTPMHIAFSGEKSRFNLEAASPKPIYLCQGGSCTLNTAMANARITLQAPIPSTAPDKAGSLRIENSVSSGTLVIDSTYNSIPTSGSSATPSLTIYNKTSDSTTGSFTSSASYENAGIVNLGKVHNLTLDGNAGLTFYNQTDAQIQTFSFGNNTAPYGATFKLINHGSITNFSADLQDGDVFCLKNSGSAAPRNSPTAPVISTSSPNFINITGTSNSKLSVIQTDNAANTGVIRLGGENGNFDGKAYIANNVTNHPLVVSTKDSTLENIEFDGQGSIIIHHATYVQDSAITSYSFNKVAPNGVRGIGISSTNGLSNRTTCMYGSDASLPSSGVCGPNSAKQPILIQESTESQTNGNVSFSDASCRLASSSPSAENLTIHMMVDDTAYLGDVYLHDGITADVRITKENFSFAPSSPTSATPTLQTPIIFNSNDSNIYIQGLATFISQQSSSKWPTLIHMSTGQSATFINDSNGSSSQSISFESTADYSRYESGASTPASATTYLFTDPSQPFSYTVGSSANQGAMTITQQNTRTGDLNITHNNAASPLTLNNYGTLGTLGTLQTPPTGTLTLSGSGEIILNNKLGGTLTDVSISGNASRTVTNETGATVQGTITFASASATLSPTYSYTNQDGADSSNAEVILSSTFSGEANITHNDCTHQLDVKSTARSSQNNAPTLTLDGKGPIKYTMEASSTNSVLPIQSLTLTGTGERTLHPQGSIINGKQILFSGTTACTDGCSTLYPSTNTLLFNTSADARLGLEIKDNDTPDRIRLDESSNLARFKLISDAPDTNATSLSMDNYGTSNIMLSGSRSFEINQYNNDWKYDLVLEATTPSQENIQATYIIRGSNQPALTLSGLPTPYTECTTAQASQRSATQVLLDQSTTTADFTIQLPSPSSSMGAITIENNFVPTIPKDRSLTLNSYSLQTLSSTNNAYLQNITFQGAGTQTLTNNASIAKSILIDTQARSGASITLTNTAGGQIGSDFRSVTSIDSETTAESLLYELYRNYESQDSSLHASLDIQPGASGTITFNNQNTSFMPYIKVEGSSQEKTRLQSLNIQSAASMVTIGDLSIRSDNPSFTPSGATTSYVQKLTLDNTTDPTISTSSTDTTTPPSTIQGEPSNIIILPDAEIGQSRMSAQSTSIDLSKAVSTNVYLVRGAVVHGNIDLGSQESNELFILTDGVNSPSIPEYNFKNLASSTNIHLKQFDLDTSTWVDAPSDQAFISLLPVASGDSTITHFVSLPISAGAQQMSDQLILNKTAPLNQWLVDERAAGISMVSQQIKGDGENSSTFSMQGAYPWRWISDDSTEVHALLALQNVRTDQSKQHNASLFSQSLRDINLQMLIASKWAWKSEEGWMDKMFWAGNGQMFTIKPTASLGVGRTNLSRQYTSIVDGQANQLLNASSTFIHFFGSAGAEVALYQYMQDTSRIGVRFFNNVSFGMHPGHNETDGPFHNWTWKSHTFQALFSKLGLEYDTFSPEPSAFNSHFALSAIANTSLDSNIGFVNQQNPLETDTFRIKGLRRLGVQAHMSLHYGSYALDFSYEMLKNFQSTQNDNLRQYTIGLHWSGI